ncbi:MAG TPA: transcription-repair coupling factor, partial [Verrucomicrobiae bacterium]|nr:transcription-repair coupling factor [Verrucomicrobiae bacterium]
MGNRTIEAFQKTPAAATLRQRLEQGGALSCSGVNPSSHPFLAACARRWFPNRPIVIVTEALKKQEAFTQDLETWFRNDEIDLKAHFYPAWEVLPHETRLPHADVIAERLETLLALTKSNAAPVIVTTPAALMQKTFTPGEIDRRSKTLNRGDRIDPLDLIEWLEDQGYEPEAQVTQKGEIALRGGILDIFPLTQPWPIRLEFFGDELESLRTFDPLTQISRDEILLLSIAPAGELGFLKQQIGAGQPAATLLEHLPKDAILILSEPDLVADHAYNYERHASESAEFIIPWEKLPTEKFTQLQLREEEPENESETFALAFSNLDAWRPLLTNLPDPQIAETQRREFFAQMHRWLRQGYAVQVFCNNAGERERFEEIWREYGFEGEQRPDAVLGALSRGFVYEEAKLVVITDAEIFGRYKVQRPRRMKSPHAAATRSALDIDFSELNEGDYVVHLQHGIGRFLGLKIVPTGSGAKLGQAVDPSDGQECLVIEYAPNDPVQPAPKLYVPVTEAHLVSKYVGTGKARPQLNALGGTRWLKAKVQAEQAVRDLASELLQIQAARESQQGHAFPADTAWQREFEASFLYEETPDQMKAIVAAKADMESQKPMDRLICGDVGYGKTEVAIRAAFKSVMSGKQVAVLVPTTVLAQQHFNTLRERMADYPIRVEQLSRFRTKKEQRKIIEELARGDVDIVVGTHRLIQDDVVFKDLGLVVIDEEQRFGVMHKEKFKLLRKLVDVLTLSATPIPRTLYLALTGAREMSAIETPPQDRLPVETVVTQYDERLIRDSIQRELNRQGQVYFLHNRVTDIHSVALRVRTLVPEARVVVGHGQMDADELEDVMRTFINGDADVLVSTTIIESGIDIPNANTIIIDRADRFGLSDLYQLRGRVGRYKHQAYAYLLLPRHAALLSDVRKRISAIKQYSSLGSGFKIAMRDLEIRGAGNLLGPQQSGHITAVGFDLYCQLLKQSVSSLKGEKVKPRIEVQMRLDFLALNPGEESTPAKQKLGGPREAADDLVINVPRETATYSGKRKKAAALEPAPFEPIVKAPAYIPLKYISDSQQRIEAYRKLAQTSDKEGLEKLRREWRDRFGKLPAPMELLLQVTELKLLAAEKNITVVETREDKLMLTRNGDYIQIGGK